MKITEIRALQDGDLQVQLDKARKQLFELRVKASIESIENPREIQQLKRTVARILTEQRAREIEAQRTEA